MSALPFHDTQVGLDGIGTEGDLGGLATLLGFVDPARGSFPIVTP